MARGYKNASERELLRPTRTRTVAVMGVEVEAVVVVAVLRCLAQPESRSVAIRLRTPAGASVLRPSEASRFGHGASRQARPCSSSRPSPPLSRLLLS